jgi:hypothetical protein
MEVSMRSQHDFDSSSSWAIRGIRSRNQWGEDRCCFANSHPCRNNPLWKKLRPCSMSRSSSARLLGISLAAAFRFERWKSRFPVRLAVSDVCQTIWMAFERLLNWKCPKFHHSQFRRAESRVSIRTVFSAWRLTDTPLKTWSPGNSWSRVTQMLALSFIFLLCNEPGVQSFLPDLPVCSQSRPQFSASLDIPERLLVFRLSLIVLACFVNYDIFFGFSRAQITT